MLKGFASFLFIALLSACSVPETRIYNMSLPAEKGRADARADASITIILHAPRYLSQPYIAHRDSPYRLEISRYSKWDAAPNDMLRDIFRDSILSTGLFKEVRVSTAALQGFYTMKLNIRRFERSDEDDASFGELIFDYSLVSPENIEIYRGTVSKRVKLQDKSFLSLAMGLSSALREGIDEVKKAISLSVGNKSPVK